MTGKRPVHLQYRYNFTSNIFELQLVDCECGTMDMEGQISRATMALEPGP
jgi:hypothetical protein